VTSAVSASFLKSPRVLDAGVVFCGLLTGFLTPLVLNDIDRLYAPYGFGGSSGLVFAIGGIPFAVLIALIASIAAETVWWRAIALLVATLVATSVAITLSAHANAALSFVAEPQRELIGGPIGGVVGSGLIALAAALLGIGPRQPARWLPMVLVGTVLGLLLAVDVWLDSENIWVIFPVWQAAVALMFLRTLRNASG
jgi:hypothetical protein